MYVNCMYIIIIVIQINSNTNINNLKMDTYMCIQVMNDDKALYNWLVAMEEYGIFLLKSAPTTESAIKPLANRVAFARETCYG